jgi:hypothetical protein
MVGKLEISFECDDIAPAQFAIDGEIEHRQVARSAGDL